MQGQGSGPGFGDPYDIQITTAQKAMALVLARHDPSVQSPMSAEDLDTLLTLLPDDVQKAYDSTLKTYLDLLSKTKPQ